MSRAEQTLIERLNATGEGASTLEEKCRLAEMFRMTSPDAGQNLYRMLIGDRDRMRIALQEAQGNLAEVQRLLARMTDPPWQIGIFLGHVDGGVPAEERRAIVFHGGSRRVVRIADGVDAASLSLGDEVFLSNELALVIDKSPKGIPRVGETAVFDRYTADGRLVLKWRDDELIVDPSGPLQLLNLETGDRVRWDRSAWIAYEKLERESGQRWFLGEVPRGGLEQVGGQGHNLDVLRTALEMRLVSPEKAALYGLNGRMAALMVGPPGCGKTLMARVACARIAAITGKECRFAVVKPGEWLDPYIGVTEARIRDCFRAMVEAGRETGLAVLFLDEIESIGRTRGSAVGHHSDRFLGALLAELDGFADRGGVTALAATNRPDIVDPSLLDRFDIQIPVGRPDMRGAREIFEIHLPDSIPFSPNGDAASATRRELADRAVSRLYGPNAGNEVCVIKFRDGKTRTVSARELVSGRMIEQICRSARQAAFVRDVRSDDRGLRAEDIDEAVSAAIHRLSTLITPRNAHSHLADLPQDVDVVAVEPIVRRVKHAHRYLNVA
jgi:proteasome-associated ATPase